MASILYVGVDNADRRTAQAALVNAGHVVIEAATAEFLRIPGERPVDAAIIDITPMMHNVHLIGIMELRRRYSALPVIAICGGRDAGALLNIAAQAGAGVTLPKPFTADQILQAVARCLGGP